MRVLENEFSSKQYKIKSAIPSNYHDLEIALKENKKSNILSYYLEHEDLQHIGTSRDQRSNEYEMKVKETG